MSNAKKTNARIEKWRAMLAEGIHKDKSLLHSRTRKGIPTSLRNIVWVKLPPLEKHIEQRKIDINYEKLVKQVSNNVYEIGLDIPRTFPEEEESRTLGRSMNDVLKALAIVYPKIGYCQGMNFLTMRVLEVLDNEKTFWLLHYLFQNDHYLAQNFENPSSVLLHDYIFESLMQMHLPQLYNIIKNKSVHLNSFTMKSFMTLFSGCLKQEPFNRIFEVYLLEGWSVIYAVALAMFKIHEKQFAKTQSIEGLQQIITKKVFQIEDIDALMHQAYKFDILQEDISKRQRKYLKQNRSMLQSQKTQLQTRVQTSKKVHSFTPQMESIKEVLLSSRPKFDGQFEIMEVLKHKIN